MVVMFLAIMRQCMIKKPTIASAKAASMTNAKNSTAGLHCSAQKVEQNKFCQTKSR